MITIMILINRKLFKLNYRKIKYKKLEIKLMEIYYYLLDLLLVE